MKLPEAQRAVIAPAKIQNYLLSTSHPIGRFKEPFFASLGYTVANWQNLSKTCLRSGPREKPSREEKVRMAKRTNFMVL